MQYSISEDVPESWFNIIDTFCTVVEYDVEFNKGVPIDNVRFDLHRGLLRVIYEGGNKLTDAFALFAREMSGGICNNCGLPSTRIVFGSPKCESCD